MTPTKVTATLAGLFGLISLWLTLRMEGHNRPDFMVLLCYWVLSPYPIPVIAARFGRLRTVTWGAPAVMVIIGLLGNLAYADVNFHFTSKQDLEWEALVFLFMPFFQYWVAVYSLGLLLAIGFWLERREGKTGVGARDFGTKQ